MSESSNSFWARYSCCTGVVDGKLYTIGGEEALQIPIQEFDPATQSWTTPSFTNEDSSLFGGTSCTVGGKIYIIGGIDRDQGHMDSDLIIVDPIARTMTRPTTIGQFVPRAAPASATVGGLIYVFGGATDFAYYQPIDTIEVLDTSTLTIRILKTTGPYSPCIGMSASVVNGKIYLIGGSARDSLSDKVQVFDPATNTWSRPVTTGYFAARAFHAAGVIDNKIFVAGGGNGFPLEWLTSQVGLPDTNELQMFDPATNTWGTPKTTGTFTSRTYLQGEVIDGKLYTIGGYRPHGLTSFFEAFIPNKSGVAQRTIDNSTAVFPNPAKNFVTLSGIQSDVRQIEVENYIGVPVSIITPPATDAANGDMQLDLSQLQPGAYFIRIEYLDGRNELRAVVKE